MVTIQTDEGSGVPTLSSVRHRYGLDPEDLDEQFGVVQVDPADHLYVVLAEPEAAAIILEAAVPEPEHGQATDSDDPTDDRKPPAALDDGRDSWQTEGPFSNPRIAPFGPPEADE